MVCAKKRQWHAVARSREHDPRELAHCLHSRIFIVQTRLSGDYFLVFQSIFSLALGGVDYSNWIFSLLQLAHNRQQFSTGTSDQLSNGRSVKHVTKTAQYLSNKCITPVSHDQTLKSSPWVGSSSNRSKMILKSSRGFTDFSWLKNSSHATEWNICIRMGWI